MAELLEQGKSTPGPWFWRRIDRPGNTIYSHIGPSVGPPVLYFDTYTMRFNVSDADAQLIAASPNVLLALKALAHEAAKHSQSDELLNSALGAAFSAIELAEGSEGIR